MLKKIYFFAQKSKLSCVTRYYAGAHAIMHGAHAIMLVPTLLCWCPRYYAGAHAIMHGAHAIMLVPTLLCWCPRYYAGAHAIMLVPTLLCMVPTLLCWCPRISPACRHISTGWVMLGPGLAMYYNVCLIHFSAATASIHCQLAYLTIEWAWNTHLPVCLWVSAMRMPACRPCSRDWLPFLMLTKPLT